LSAEGHSDFGSSVVGVRNHLGNRQRVGVKEICWSRTLGDRDVEKSAAESLLLKTAVINSPVLGELHVKVPVA
jgi:hypothetical protein